MGRAEGNEVKKHILPKRHNRQ